MIKFSKVAVAAAMAALAAVPMASQATVNIDGVVFNAGSQFLSTTLWEKKLTGVDDTLEGVGIVNQIINDDGIGLTWSNGNNGTQLTYHFSGYTVESWKETVDLGDGSFKVVTHKRGDADFATNFLTNATSIQFGNGKVDLFSDKSTLLGPSTSSTIANDLANATDGNLWLQYEGVNTFDFISKTTGTLFASAAGSASSAHIGGFGFGYMNATAGLAFSNFDTNSWKVATNAIGGTTKADAYFGSNYSTTNSGNWPLSGTADFKTSAIPEPASLALVSLALMGAGFAARRKSGK